MAKQGTKGATPTLRFPEFRDTGAWTSVDLGKIARLVTERVGFSDCVPYTITSGVGLVSQQEKLGRTIAGQSLKNYLVLQQDDFAYNKSATKAYPQGYIARYQGIDRAAVPNSIFTCFRVKEGDVNPIFLENLFGTNLHGNWLHGRIAVGARAHGSLNVSDDDLMALPVPLPPIECRREEQQKIADCLTSLDEVITAQERKVEALKAHKRGLMQQLFPREGETRPRLRFPEFRNAPEWTPGTLGGVCEVLNNRRIPISSGDRRSGPFPYYGASGVVDFVDRFIFDERLLLVGEDGAKWGAFEQTAFIADGKYWVNNHAHVLKPLKVIDTLLAAYLTMIDLATYVTGHAPPKLTLAKLRSIALVYPESSSEQQRIAECLASLDTRITAESNQLAALKTHKQGLMQQLFPAPEAAGA